METIANETESRPDDAAAGRNPYRLVDIQCAPRYNDEVRTTEVPAVWVPIAQKLVDAGRDRAFHSNARGVAGLELLHEAWAKIRGIWFAEAAPAGMSQVTAAKLVGISRAQFHSIITGNVGGKGVRGAQGD